MIEGKMKKLDIRMGNASAVKRVLQYSVVMKRELSRLSVSVFQRIFVPILTYGYESWVWLKEYDRKCKRQKWDFCEESKELYVLTKKSS